jgi:hypothetical protein
MRLPQSQQIEVRPIQHGNQRQCGHGAAYHTPPARSNRARRLARRTAALYLCEQV